MTDPNEFLSFTEMLENVDDSIDIAGLTVDENITGDFANEENWNAYSTWNAPEFDTPIMAPANVQQQTVASHWTRAVVSNATLEEAFLTAPKEDADDLDESDRGEDDPLVTEEALDDADFEENALMNFDEDDLDFGSGKVRLESNQ
jgi:hypothetical protein